MKILSRLIAGFAILIVIAGIYGGYRLSDTSPCPQVRLQTLEGATMMAVRQLCYGPPASLVYSQVPIPSPGAGEMLIEVHAAGVNPLDWHTMRGSPYFMRLSSGLSTPTDPRFGVDFSGVVTAIGPGVTRFEPGDRVFGGAAGAFAQYVLVRENHAVSHLPDEISHPQAAAVAIAGLTALQSLRDKGKLQPGQKVLINGASGGVGSFAVQIARHMGGEVYGVSSTRNVERVMAMGATRVFDYTREDYTESGQRFDLIVDTGGRAPLRKLRRTLAERGADVIVGAQTGGRIAGGVGRHHRAVDEGALPHHVPDPRDQRNAMDLAQILQLDAFAAAARRNHGQNSPSVKHRRPPRPGRDA